jgi:hypothetical protein
MSGVWGVLGFWAVIHFPDNKAILITIAYVLYIMCILIPVRLIAARSKNDLHSS